MSGWEGSVKSREPDPGDAASRKEELAGCREGLVTNDLNEEEMDLLRGILRKLMKQDGARYIVFREFLLRDGAFFVRYGDMVVKPYWGFYSELADRWDCSANTVKNWLKGALSFIVENGREAVSKRRHQRVEPAEDMERTRGKE